MSPGQIQRSGARERLAVLRCATLEPYATGRGDRAWEFERRHSGSRPLRDHKDTQGGGSARARELATPGGAGVPGLRYGIQLQDTSIGDRAGLSAQGPEAPNTANKRGN
ncbi:hypothetical protein NDU88_002189 [Pleurodeles waltl]|uniref:Uncharacterized protein n=1 Tax=Pleurodeles waltl TaxID=8319 RepID=A0AAV7M2N1_PLEWA|nr:hypothetical protein NDU88_002189 [Pleurodeles waltl]